MAVSLPDPAAVLLLAAVVLSSADGCSLGLAASKLCVMLALLLLTAPHTTLMQRQSCCCRQLIAGHCKPDANPVLPLALLGCCCSELTELLAAMAPAIQRAW
jgi:hypothetical protein